MEKTDAGGLRKWRNSEAEFVIGAVQLFAYIEFGFWSAMLGQLFNIVCL